MALAIGLSSTKVDFIDHAYVMQKSILFDGVDDFGRFNLESVSPANGTMKPLENGLTLAAWVKLTDDESDGAGVYNTTATQGFFGCRKNGGFAIYYSNKRFSGAIALQDGDGNTATLIPVTAFSHARLLASNQLDKPLYKSDGWHFVVMTWDGNRVANLYVDGGRDLAGTAGSAMGSMPETSESKKTAASPGGNNPSGDNKWFIKYGDDAVDEIIGSQISYNTSLTPITFPNGGYLGGYAGDFAQWNRCLTSSEVTTLYNLHKPIDMTTMHPDDITGYYRTTNTSGTNIEAVIGTDITLGQVLSPVTEIPTLDVTTLGGGYA